jgi:hypothetical protein
LPGEVPFATARAGVPLADARKTLFKTGFADFVDEVLDEDAGFGGTGTFVSRVLSFLAFIVRPRSRNDRI